MSQILNVAVQSYCPPNIYYMCIRPVGVAQRLIGLYCHTGTKKPFGSQPIAPLTCDNEYWRVNNELRSDLA